MCLSKTSRTIHVEIVEVSFIMLHVASFRARMAHWILCLDSESIFIRRKEHDAADFLATCATLLGPKILPTLQTRHAQHAVPPFWDNDVEPNGAVVARECPPRVDDGAASLDVQLLQENYHAAWLHSGFVVRRLRAARDGSGFCPMSFDVVRGTCFLVKRADPGG